MTRDGLLPYVETGWYRCTFRTLPQYESLGVARRWVTYQNDSENNLNVVIFVNKGTGLVQESIVLYWIRESGLWKLAVFQGSD